MAGPTTDPNVTTAKTIYLAGPMRGIPEFNFPAFLDAERRLSPWFEVISPARHDLEAGFDPTLPLDEQGFDLGETLLWDLEQVRVADAVILLPGWSRSEGAVTELQLAHTLGKGAYTYRPIGDGDLYSLERLSSGPSEVRVVNEKTGGAKGQKLARFDLIPADVEWIVAELYGKGAEKYEDRNWERGYDWSLSYAALRRHLNLFWRGEDIDAETNCPHLASVIFHAMALLHFTMTHPELDDRPKP